MEVKFIPIDRLYREIQHTLFKRYDDIYSRHDQFNGPMQESCQELLKEMTGRKYVRLASSGTSSISLMLMASGVKPRQRVAVTNYSCPATVTPIKIIGAVPVFQDINQYGQMDVEDVAPCDHLLVTGLYGDNVNWEAIKRLEVPVLNDSAQSFMSKFNGVESTKFGLMSIISFSTNKICPVFGTYGAVLTDNEDLDHKVMLMRRNGYKNRDVGEAIEYLGINAQPMEDKSAQLLTGLENVKEWQSRRKEIKNLYDEKLNDTGVSVRQSPEGSQTNDHKYCIFVKNKRSFRDKMKILGVDCQLHYTYDFSKTPAYEGISKINYRWTNFYKQHAISLPSSPWHTQEEIKYVIECVKQTITNEDLEICQKM